MASEIKLPELGENLEGGEVLEVKVAVGDTVRQGQALVEVEAEKSTVEVPSPVAGRVAQLLVKKGDSVKVGQTLCLIDAVNGAPSAEAAKVEPARAAAPAGKPPAAPDGEKAKGKAAPPPPPRETDGARPTLPTAEQPVPAGPATRRLARELGVDLRQVTGTAPGGRISAEDVKGFVRQIASAPAAAGTMPGPKAPALPDFERWGPVERKPLDQIRRKTAQILSLAWNLAPHVTQHDEADITDLDAFRRQQEGKGPKLTMTAFALKAAAIALQQMPQFNTSLDMASGQLVFKRYYHLGVAVDTDRGLLVPVIRDVDKKSVRQLAQELTDIAEKARQHKITLDEMRGGTFTISNLGGIGGTAFTPIINYPEVAILGLARARWQPVVRDGQVVTRLMLPLSLSYDHRVIDGADGARFTRQVASLLESPLLMLLDA